MCDLIEVMYKIWFARNFWERKEHIYILLGRHSYWQDIVSGSEIIARVNFSDFTRPWSLCYWRSKAHRTQCYEQMSVTVFLSLGRRATRSNKSFKPAALHEVWDVRASFLTPCWKPGVLCPFFSFLLPVCQSSLCLSDALAACSVVRWRIL